MDTVGEEAEQTHKHVSQTFYEVSVEDQIASISAILASETQEPNFKIIVFFTTARVTQYMGMLFNRMEYDVLDIHSRKSQAARTKVSDQFRKGNNMILFSSDVSARGMDYPGVTYVLQVGLTAREQYIHRLGRTARAGRNASRLVSSCWWLRALLRVFQSRPPPHPLSLSLSLSLSLFSSMCQFTHLHCLILQVNRARAA